MLKMFFLSHMSGKQLLSGGDAHSVAACMLLIIL